MSRRITLLVLAASATLIATQASADPECFGETCRMPEIVEPPAAEPTPAAPAPILETSAAPAAGYVRSARLSSPDSSYVVGYKAAPAAGIIVVALGGVYGSGRYMIAPSAKIISIDSDD